MHDRDQIGRLRYIMHRLAIIISLVTMVSLPLGYAVVSGSSQGDELHHHAEISAEQLAQYIYVHGAVWPYARERLSEIIAATQLRNTNLCQTVTLPDGREVVQYGMPPGQPVQSRSAGIVVNGVQVGTVTVESSLKPLLFRTMMVAFFGLLLGASVYVAMHLLPLSTLDKALDALQESHKRIEAHATETDYAYGELKRQYRLVEETTQELMRARDQALSADRAKSAFLATMSHELRTPLNAIIGFSEIMSNEMFGPLGDRRYREYCKSTRDSGLHLLAVINDVLDISKIEAGKLDLHCEELELRELLEDSCRLVRGKVEDVGVALELVSPAVSLPVVWVDPVKVKQIVLNLLSNALKFTAPGGKIVITTGALCDEGVYFAVTDTGIGMDEAEVALALQPFRQVDNGHARKYEGTGLGLPLAKGLVEQHGGRLEIESNPGQGTAVTVILPVKHARGVIPSVPIKENAIPVSSVRASSQAV
ncbi:HAMP domain-containing histidine kinase [Pelagibius litoralis]|uniref:histidine kinase n=1 Tax=Pelagibius litoralis TaxID=374515 RepID=A0A967KAX6_9PROT|nr:HAMP domain-containing sensor histidine kinase [Pelagibius litoralis]NIA71878.1 HAMP domain-containing histidine kinase [Pelagibius litoralis]